MVSVGSAIGYFPWRSSKPAKVCSLIICEKPQVCLKWFTIEAWNVFRDFASGYEIFSKRDSGFDFLLDVSSIVREQQNCCLLYTSTVLNVPTSGRWNFIGWEVVSCFLERYSFSLSVRTLRPDSNNDTHFFTSGTWNIIGGVIVSHFSKWYSIFSSVGKFRPDSKNDTQFPHHWGHWGPIRNTVHNFPTNGVWYFIGGEIETRFEMIHNFPTNGI